MSYLFAGGTHIITFPDAPVLDSSGTHTISYWINLTAAAATMVPVSKMGNYFAYLDYDYSGRIVHGNYKPIGDVTRGVSTVTVNIASLVGGWHNIICRTSAGVPGAVWIDGVDRTEDVDEFWFAAAQDFTQALTVGNNLALTAPVTGYVAEVAIWNNLSIADARCGDIAGGLSPVGLSTPPNWYLRLKDNAVEHYSSVAGTVSGATLNASHPLVDAPGGVGATGFKNFVDGFWAEGVWADGVWAMDEVAPSSGTGNRVQVIL